MTPNPTYANLTYAVVDGRALTLDLYLPEHGTPPYPLIVWIHGGAWKFGDKHMCREALPLLEDGFAVASVSYRLSQEAIFPAQIRDVKAAVRWLRQNASEYNLDPQRFAAWGPSAGGHLAALLGVSFYMRAWDAQGEYDECAPPEISSAVQAVCDWFGPTNFRRMMDQPNDSDHNAPDSPESQLVGGPIQEVPDKVSAANPICYVYPQFPPFLIMHGDRDRTVPPNQSTLLFDALLRWGVKASLYIVEGAGHGFEGDDYTLALGRVRSFLQRELVEKDLPQYAFYACSGETFRPRTRHKVLWLTPHSDYELARDYWAQSPEPDARELSRETWLEAHDLGYSYAAVIEEGKIVSMAAVLRYSDYAWEVAAVSTNDPNHQAQGYATSTCSFVAKYILAMQRVATLCTGIDNYAMQRVAEKMGFERVA